MSSLFPWLSRPPTIAAVAVAIVLVLIGRYVSGEQILAWLTSLTFHLRRSLESFDALHVVRTFYAELTGCYMDWTASGYEVVCTPGLDTTDILAGKSEPHPLLLLMIAIVNTVGSLWSGATWLGVIFYAVAVVAGGATVAAIVKPEDEPMLWLLWLLLIPAAAGVIALLLKWVLLLLVLLFSEVLAGVAWIAATFGAAFVWVRSVLDTAHNVDTVVAGTVASAAPPKDTPTPK